MSLTQPGVYPGYGAPCSDPLHTFTWTAKSEYPEWEEGSEDEQNAFALMRSVSFENQIESIILASFCSK